ncbi:MAG: acetate--CoA ligase [Methanomethylovorans sp.]|uniref:acetate--CoA ligase n=1 Tax=Methanomethylovorans sp. TaxID=2758717 RepID=UPI003530AA06
MKNRNNNFVVWKMGVSTNKENLMSGEYTPSLDFARKANINDPEVYQKAAQDLEGFWEELANDIHWFKKWDKVLDWQPPHAQWFIGGKLNASYNCLDVHMANRADKTAIIWEGEMGEVKTYTYRQLLEETSRFANALKKLGVKKGDIVTIYLPMIPEIVISMLACARIGSPHNVVFAAFSGEALFTRIGDAKSKFIITCDGYYRRGTVVEQKKKTDMDSHMYQGVEKVIVVKQADIEVEMHPQRDVWWHDLMKDEKPVCEAEPMDAEDMLFLMYTSGTTGKPKGIVHTTGGYVVGTHVTTKWIFDLKENDIYWCTADCGWITGHSYLVYGPLSNGATILMYEGAPDFPDKDRWWDLIERHKVTILYTAPTAIRTFMKWGDEWPQKHNLSTLRLLGSVGEAINPGAWLWYYEHIGQKKCPIVDTWWQTETGMVLITPLPGITTLKPGSATRPFPGIEAIVLDETGKEVPRGTDGLLAIKRPWPSMVRTIFNDAERFKETYWSKWDGKTYFAGDGAKQDENGYFWIIGRVDDSIKVAAHLIGTAEVESVLVSHPAVAESAVVGKLDELKGEVIYCYVILRSGVMATEKLRKELINHVALNIGPIAKPKQVIFTDDLPKTRSGKIMRRVLKAIVNDRNEGDVTTLQNPDIVEILRQRTKEIEND